MKRNKAIISLIVLIVIFIGVSSILFINHKNIKEKMFRLKKITPDINIPVITEKTTTKKNDKVIKYLDIIETTTNITQKDPITNLEEIEIPIVTEKTTTSVPIIEEPPIITKPSTPITKDEPIQEITYEELFNSEFVLQDINYKDELLSINNPNRGFYIPKYIEIDSITNRFDYHSLYKTIDQCKKENISIIHLLFDIGLLSGNVNSENIDKLFTEEQLSDISSIFELLRENNLNAVVRFAYDYDGIENKEPIDFNYILEHIKQLKNIFSNYEDVITTIESGFIGVYGEMHDSIYNSEEYYINQISTLLSNTPSSLTINVRKPAHYQMLFGNITPDKNLINYNNNKYRVGIFNDGYLATIHDMGTYKDRDEFVNWMNNHGIFTFYGGEIAWRRIEDDYLSDIDFIKDEMYKTHLTYLNFQEDGIVTHGKWLTQKYYNEDDEYNGTQALKYVNDHLGYRLLLRDSKITKYNATGSISGLTMTIENVGFTNIIKPQNVKLLLEKNNRYYETKIDLDISKLYAKEKNVYNIGFYIPSNIDIGEYNLYLKISDKTNKEYTIKFANENIFNNNIGANYLGKINITKGTNLGITFKEAFKDNYTNELISNTVLEKIYLDGKYSSNLEWLINDIIYDENNNKIYLKEDDKFIYMLIDSDNLVNTINIGIRIALKDITDIFNKAEYSLGIENSNIYYLTESGKINSERRINNAISLVKNDVIEYKINKRITGINSINDLKALYVILYGGEDNWTKLTEFASYNK